jgi:hypothetical protein
VWKTPFLFLLDHFQRFRLVFLTSVCRYSEALNILYSKNVFLVESPDVMAYLPRMLLSQSLQSIRHLRFLYDLGISPPAELWSASWKTLSEMQGLVDLRVVMRVLQGEDLWTLDDLEVLNSVTWPEKFSLFLPVRMFQRFSKIVGGSNCRVFKATDQLPPTGNIFRDLRLNPQSAFAAVAPSAPSCDFKVVLTEKGLIGTS